MSFKHTQENTEGRHKNNTFGQANAAKYSSKFQKWVSNRPMFKYGWVFATLSWRTAGYLPRKSLTVCRWFWFPESLGVGAWFANPSVLVRKALTWSAAESSWTIFSSNCSYATQSQTEIFAYTWLFLWYLVHVGKYNIHSVCGNEIRIYGSNSQQDAISLLRLRADNIMTAERNQRKTSRATRFKRFKQLRSCSAQRFPRRTIDWSGQTNKSFYL